MAVASTIGSATDPRSVPSARAAPPDGLRPGATLARALSGLALGLSILAGAPVVAAPFEILAPAEKADGRDRFALVIGNAAYRNVPSLRNPINDANAIGERLHRLGFEVTRARDLDRRATNETVDIFLARLTPGADVVVYFAGHGVEVQGANHLLPVDVPKLQVGQDRVLRSETTNLTDLMSDLRDKAPRALVMILDACRDNPFAGEGTRSIGSSRGLARVEPPKGSLVIYSAGVGERALDNLGEDDPSPNGLFTRTLLRQMDEEGLEVRDLVRRMRNEVREAALRAGGHSQTPGYYDELLDSFFFRPKPATDPNVAACERNADPEADSLSVMRRNLDPVFGACLRAMRAKPGDERLRGLFLAVAEQRAFQSALASEAPDPASNYLAHYPSGRYAADVLRHLARLERGRAEPAGATPEPAPVERRIETIAQPAPALPTAPAAPAPAAAPAPTVAVAALATKAETAPPAVPGAPASGTAVPSPAPEPAEDDREDLARELQTELKRVGCYAGPIDGVWGARARDALLAFNRAASAGLPADDPRRASVEAVRLQEARVCPLQCGIGRRPDADGERCVRVACRLGERLNDEGVCAARATLRRAALPAPRLDRPEPRPEPARRLARPEPRSEPGRAARPEPVRAARSEPAPSPREKVREASSPRPAVRSLSAAPAREEEPPARRVQPRVVAEPPPTPRLARRPPPRPAAEPRVVAEPAPARIMRRPAAPPRPAAEPQPVVVHAPPPPGPRLGIGIGFGGGRLGIGGIGIGF